MATKRKPALHGWKPDQKDARDFVFKAQAPALPRKVDLRRRCTAVENQGELGSCTGNAIVSAVEYLRYPSRANYSRLFVYYNERMLEGTIDIDNGAQIRTGIKTLSKFGVCREVYHRYDIDRFRDKPTDKAYTLAATCKIKEYRRATSLLALRQALAAGSPVVFGFTVFASFQSTKVYNTGVMPMPKKGEGDYGGHAVLAVGYDDDARVVICRNSWGKEWGDSGYFYMPYDFISNEEWASDFWTFSL